MKTIKESEKILNKLITEFNLEEYSDEIFKLAATTIIFTSSKIDNYENIGNTRFGGFPDLPEDIDWPISNGENDIEDKGKFFNFICQINLQEIAHLNNYLPKSGLLYFFSGEYYYEPEIKVIYYSGDLNKLVKKEVDNDDIVGGLVAVDIINNTASKVPMYKAYKVEIENILTLPHPYLNKIETSVIGQNKEIEKRYSDMYDIYHENLEEYTASMLGHFYWEHEVKDNEDFLDSLILLEVTSDSKIDFCFSDAGILAFSINEEDLINKNFEKIYAAVSSA
jgi:uncharacterized protein YwqG